MKKSKKYIRTILTICFIVIVLPILILCYLNATSTTKPLKDKDTIDIIYEDKMYKELIDIHERNTGGGIVFFEIEFTTKEADKPRYGLICEFLLDNPSILSQDHEPEETIWICTNIKEDSKEELKGSPR